MHGLNLTTCKQHHSALPAEPTATNPQQRGGLGKQRATPGVCRKPGTKGPRSAWEKSFSTQPGQSWKQQWKQQPRRPHSTWVLTHICTYRHSHTKGPTRSVLYEVLTTNLWTGKAFFLIQNKFKRLLYFPWYSAIILSPVSKLAPSPCARLGALNALLSSPKSRPSFQMTFTAD